MIISIFSLSSYSSFCIKNDDPYVKGVKLRATGGDERKCEQPSGYDVHVYIYIFIREKENLD